MEKFFSKKFRKRKPKGGRGAALPVFYNVSKLKIHTFCPTLLKLNFCPKWVFKKIASQNYFIT
jgi:hypothetical protein